MLTGEETPDWNDKENLFERTKGFLMIGEPVIPDAQAARGLNHEKGALRVSVHRLCARYRALLRAGIAQTLDEPAQVAEELRSFQAGPAG